MTKTTTRKPCRGMTRARKAARWSAFLGLATVFATPATAQYVWSLGDLSNASSRLDVNWDHDDWADAYDSEAELNALGWSTVNIDESTPGISCSHGGRGSSEDKAGLQALLDANCPGRSGFTPGVCNNVFKIAANCTIDTLSDYTNDNASQPGININYSNFALIGASVTTSVVSANNVVDANTDRFAELFGTGLNDVGSGGADGSTFTWDGGSSSVKGQSVIQIDNNCSGVAPGDLIRVQGADPGGSPLVYITRIVAEAVDGVDCDIRVADPLPTTFAGRTSVTIEGQGGPKNQVYMNFTARFPYLPDGACTSIDPGLGCGYGLETRNSQQLLIQGVRWGPLGHSPLATAHSYRVVVRNNDFGPARHTLRRQNNGSGFSRNTSGSLMSVYDNVFREGVVRVGYFSDGSAQFGYLGFNYQVPQLPSNPAEGGNYCGAISNPQGFPNVSAGPERSIFLNHDAPFGPGVVGQVLIEANDFKCRLQKEFAHSNGRYITLFRNRFIGQSPVVDFAGGDIGYVNLIANRVGTWGFAAGIMDNVFGNWNIGESSIPTPTGTSVTWPTTGTGKNYLEPASTPHDDYTRVNLPPSLGFRSNTAPSWWCQESGPWDGNWSFGYGDGGDNGGVPRKLPAQIRFEGRTCTPPAGVAGSLPPPVFLE